MRAYLPLTMAGLRGFVADGVISRAAAVVAHSDSEEDEYAAMLSAAELSQELLTEPGRRVVAVVETEEPDQVPIADLVAIHVDTEPIGPGDEDPPELAWFAVPELDDLLG